MDGDYMLARCVEQSFVAPIGMSPLESTSNFVVITEPHNSHRQQKRILVASWISNSFNLNKKDTNNPLKDTVMAKTRRKNLCGENPTAVFDVRCNCHVIDDVMGLTMIFN